MDSVVHLPAHIIPSCESPPLRCCCGSAGCVVLRHNCAVLEGVEKDVHMAAKLGQALLVRHETYMADATRDRETLTARIAHLEAENLRLENLNAQTISENRSLLEQLETLNTSASESDSRTRVLEANLQASQQAVRRLEIAASRAADMERHISGLEAELEEAHESMFTTEEEARGALRRWRAAERTVSDLQDQVEKMEKGAREERERQAEVIARMERQRDLERELGAAAGRLKGAAAARNLGAGGAGDSGTAVSAFLRDLLQDNASLQLGIAELRELLSSSREEIHTLRECLRDHQPAHDTPNPDSSPSTLRAELRIPPSPPGRETPSREVHIHHHYHAAAKPEAKKPKKKRQVVSAALFAPLPSTPSMLSDRGPALPLSPSTSHTADFYSAKATESETGLSCWSPIRAGFESSPSSPRSNPRASVFDRGLEGLEPLSPSTSVDVVSPRWRGKRSAPGLVPASPSPSVCAAMVDSSSAKRGGILPDEHEHSDAEVRPSLRRTVSHESIISLGGLDIHTLHSRPSQLTLHRLGGAQAVLTDITAQPTISRSGPRGSSVLRESLASLPGSPSPVASPSIRSSSSARWSGWRPWRLSDGPGPREDEASQVAESVLGTDDGSSVRTGVATSETADHKDRDKEAAALARDSLRAPGINQPGAIPGFSEFLAQAKRRVSSRVVPEEVDREALGDAFD